MQIDPKYRKLHQLVSLGKLGTTSQEKLSYRNKNIQIFDTNLEMQKSKRPLIDKGVVWRSWKIRDKVKERVERD